MKFEKSGLPDHEMVKKAFDMSWENQKDRFDYQTQHAIKDIDAEIEAHKRQLTALGNAGQMPIDQVLGNKRKLDVQKEQAKQQIVNGLSLQREQDFLHNMVEPARLAASASENPTPQLVAAVLLRESVRSPIDFERIHDGFGPEVSGMLKNFMHLEAYPTEREKKLPDASDDVKRMSLLMAIGAMQSMIGVAERATRQMIENEGVMPGQDIRVVMVGGDTEARRMIRTAELTRGTDTKLDAQFVQSFNRMSAKIDIGLKLEVGADNKLIVREVPRADTDGPFGGGPGMPPNFFGNDGGGTPGAPKTGGGKGYGKI